MGKKIKVSWNMTKLNLCLRVKTFSVDRRSIQVNVAKFMDVDDISDTSETYRVLCR